MATAQYRHLDLGAVDTSQCPGAPGHSQRALTPMCWKSQERITFVACFGRTPLLFLEEPSSWCKMLRSWFNCN